MLFASAEAYSFVKVGGLADVSGALPKRLAAPGLDVRLVIPAYRGLGGSPVPSFGVPFGLVTERVVVRRLPPLGGVVALTLGLPGWFEREPKNIRLDPDRLVVFDFDRAARAPAGRDLRPIIGQTLTMGAAPHGNLAAAEPWVVSFLAGYSDGGGDPEAVRSAAAYVARTFAEVPFYRLVVRPVTNSSFVPVWLEAWEAAVGAASGGGYR